MTPIELQDLHVSINGTELIQGASLSIPANATVGIVGESGSGKSLTAKAISGLLPRGAHASGSLKIMGTPIDPTAPERTWEAQRGSAIVWLPQDPFSSLNPLRTCGSQIAAGSRLPKAKRRGQAERLLADVGLSPALYDSYPHELSGGMRQRVAIAAALAPQPQVFIADEPTTALDASTQKDVLDLLQSTCSKHGMTLIIITHDLPLAADRADYLVIFDKGRVVEEGPSEKITTSPQSSYTKELLEAHRRLQNDDNPEIGDTVLCVEHLTRHFAGNPKPSVDDVSLGIHAGEILGLVGESGSGKSTVARCVAGLEKPDKGTVTFYEKDSRQPLPWSREQAQLVFQNPFGSLNPVMTVAQTLKEALWASGRTDDAQAVRNLMESVGLSADLADRKPLTLSGGQCQRVAIARAIAPQPRLLIADEAVTALDANIQAHVLQTLLGLRSSLNLAILFISHDLDTVRRISDRIAVMQNGKVIESGTTDAVLNHPQHAYVRKLIAAMPPALD